MFGSLIFFNYGLKHVCVFKQLNILLGYLAQVVAFWVSST